MKLIGKLSLIAALLLLTSFEISAQTRGIKQMYREQEAKEKAERLRETQERHQLEQALKRQVILEEAFVAAHQYQWLKILGADGIRRFDPRRVEQILLDAGFATVEKIPTKYAGYEIEDKNNTAGYEKRTEYKAKNKASSSSAGDISIEIAPSKRLVDIDFEQTTYYPLETGGIYQIKNPADVPVTLEFWHDSYTEGDGSNFEYHPEAMGDNHPVAFPEIRTDVPLLFIKGRKTKDGGKSYVACAILSSDYTLEEDIYCKPPLAYRPTANKRIKAIKKSGFSEKTANRYGLINPWNLVIYNGCTEFDGHELVESVVMAWRFATVSNDGKHSNNQRDIRYVYKQKDGKEHEEGPKEVWKLPLCVRRNKSEDPSFESQVQYNLNPGHPSSFERLGGGCNSIPLYIPETPQIRTFDVDEAWFF